MEARNSEEPFPLGSSGSGQLQDEAPASSRDDVDWHQIYGAHVGRLRRVIAKRVPRDAVDDVLQETFLRAYRSRERRDPTRPIEPWLTTIAIRASADRRAVLESSLAETPHPLAPDAHEEFLANERRRVVATVFRSLGRRQRALLHSVAIDGTSQVAIAHREGIAPEAVRAAVLRARRRFRADYERLARESGLVGAGAAKPVLLRLRNRLVRLESGIPLHADFIMGLAAAMAIAQTALATTPPPERTVAVASTPATIGQGRGTGAKPGTDVARRNQAFTSTIKAEASSRVAFVAAGETAVVGSDRATIAYEPIGFEVAVDNRGGGARVDIVAKGPDSAGDRRAFMDFEIEDCQRDRISVVTCTVVDTGRAAVGEGEPR